MIVTAWTGFSAANEQSYSIEALQPMSKVPGGMSTISICVAACRTLQARPVELIAARIVASTTTAAFGAGSSRDAHDGTVTFTRWNASASVAVPLGAETTIDAENPVHAVTISNAFYISRYEVTQAQWTAVAGTNPSFHQGSSWPNAASRPVEQVSWNDIQSFASQTGLRLPTEAEWEYACRSGASTAFHGVAGAPGGTNDDSRVTDIGWCNVNATSTLPVGLKSANGFGLHDMSGNVTEFVSDWYGGSYYASSPASDPQGPTTGSNKVARGGAFSSNSGQVRTSYRFPSYHTGLKRWDLGCRMARTP